MDDSFKSFFYNKNSENEQISISKKLNLAVIAQVGSIITADLTKLGNLDKKAEFSNKVANMASSDEVITELSNKLGKPLPSETENEFVTRGKKELRDILLKKFNVKK